MQAPGAAQGSTRHHKAPHAARAARHIKALQHRRSSVFGDPDGTPLSQDASPADVLRGAPGPAQPDAPSRRLFSALDPATLRHAPGSVLGSALLVAGTATGAGMLALPSVTAPSGFVASSGALLGCWAYSIATGLLIAEVAINRMAREGAGAGGASLVAMARRALGGVGGGAAAVTLGGLQYTLLVA